MACLDGLVKILPNCGDDSRESGVLYLNDIGISLQDATDGNDQFQTGQQLVDNKISFATNIITNHVRTNYNGKLQRNTVKSQGVAGFFRENRVEQANTANQLGGIYIKIVKYPFLEFYLHQVRLFTKDAENIELKVYDVLTGQELYTSSETTNASNYTDITINQAFKTNKQTLELFIAYNKLNVTTYQTTTSKRGCSSCTGYAYDGYMYTYGGVLDASDSVTTANIKKSSDTSGMSITYSLNCSLDNFVCSIRNELQFPLLYLVGSELMKEIIRSKRENSTTLIHQADAREMQAEFENTYNMAMFGAFNDSGNKVKEGVLEQISLPNDICFKCRKNVRQIARIP